MGELEELDAVCLFMKDGYEDHYDPIVTLDVCEYDVAINNGFYHTYRITLDMINKIVTYKRKPTYHQDIDVVEYTDYDHETIWENKQWNKYDKWFN